MNLRPPGYEPGELPDCSTPRRGRNYSAGHVRDGEAGAEHDDSRDGIQDEVVAGDDDRPGDGQRVDNASYSDHAPAAETDESDADAEGVIEYVEHGLRLVRSGGTVLVPRVLAGGAVADPVRRGPVESAYRSLIQETQTSPAVLGALSIVGEGLLQLTTVNDG